MKDSESLRLENQLCFPLYVCAKEFIQHYKKYLDPLQMTYMQYIVMMALWEYGKMTVSELGKKVRLDSGTLTPLLKRLETRGYIRRVRMTSDERKLSIQLTEEGERLREQTLAIPELMHSSVALSDEEMIIMKGLLEKMLNHI